MFDGCSSVRQYDLLAIFFLCIQKSSDQDRDGERLPPQPESPSSTVTSRQLSTSESVTGQQNQTKIGKLFDSCTYYILLCKINASDVHTRIHTHVCIKF